jgi:enoyl-CoA hydratase/carnithine racemase
MSTSQPGYFSAYENFALERSPSGVLTVRFHTDGGPAVFTGTTHHDLPRLIEEIAYDRDNTVVVLTGTGDRFMTEIDGPSLGDLTKPMSADLTYVEGRRFTNGSFTAQQALEWGAIAEVVPLDEVLPRAQAIAEQITALSQLTSRYMAVLFRQRISRRLAEGTSLGMALEALTAANLAYLQPA